MCRPSLEIIVLAFVKSPLQFLECNRLLIVDNS